MLRNQKFVVLFILHLMDPNWPQLEDLDVEMRKFTQEKPLEAMDEVLWEYSLSSWAYDMKLRQCILIHQLGFELEIYHKDELSAAYWYGNQTSISPCQTNRLIGHFNGYVVPDTLTSIES